MFARLWFGLIFTCALPIGLAQAEPWQAGGSQWRPFSYDDSEGKPRGISVDIVQRVFELASIDAQFVSYPVNRLQAMLGKNELDLSYSDSVQWNKPEELRRFVFSEPYMHVREHLYFLREHPAARLPVEKLEGLTIGTVRGYTYRSMDPAFVDKRLTRLDTSEDPALLKLLLARRVDAVAMVDELLDYLVVQHHLDPALIERGARLSDAPISLKLQPQHAPSLPAINRAIRTLITNGDVARIREHYLKP
jgi:polar amino acid transport system substrate-binding protein